MIGVIADRVNVAKQVNQQQLVGSEQAVNEYIKAMLAYLPEGQVILFVDPKQKEEWELDLSRLGYSYNRNCLSHSILPLDAVTSRVKLENISVFHTPKSFGEYRKLDYIRQVFSTRIFPITSLVHGLSYHIVQQEMYNALLAPNVLDCDSVICTSVAARDAFCNRLMRIASQINSKAADKNAAKVRTDIIPLGVDVDIFRPRDKGDARRLLGLPEDPVIVLYFGRICTTGKMDPLPVLVAFERLFEKYNKDVYLVIAGNCTSEANSHIERTLETLSCSGQVEVRHQPSLVEGPLYYAAADIFVSPIDTLSESFGIAPLEAQAAALPAIVSAWSAYTENIIHGETGFHIPTYWDDCNDCTDALAPVVPWEQHHSIIHQSVAVDIEALSFYLDLLVSNEDLRHSMGMAGRKHVLEKFTWNSVMRQCEALWGELQHIANTIPTPQQEMPHIDTTKSYKDFHHFVSHPLKDDDLIEVTSRGHAAMRDGVTLKPISSLEPVLKLELISKILHFFVIASIMKRSLSYKEIIEKVMLQFDLPRQVICYHLLWLTKYGYLRILGMDY